MYGRVSSSLGVGGGKQSKLTPTLANIPTFHIHKLLEVVHSMLTIAKNDHSSIPNSLPHGKKPCDHF